MKALVVLRQIARLVEIFIAIETLVDAVLRDIISTDGGDILLVRITFAFTLFLWLQADIWIQILLCLAYRH